MRVIVLVKATEESEAGQLPSGDEFAEMGAYNEELVKAGILLAADGLKPSSAGKRVQFAGRKSTVIDGPFAEAKELVAGYWIWEVSSMEEATEWLKRAPFQDAVVEIRQMFTPEDFADVATPEQLAAEQALREQAASRPQ
jgi:hypothetical protein